MVYSDRQTSGNIGHFFSWLRLKVFRIRRRARRLNAPSTNLAKYRQRPRVSTVSSYHSVEENNSDWISRVSPSDPNQHPDSFLHPFCPWKIDHICDMDPVSLNIKEQHAFNPADASPHIHILEDDCLTMHRLPIAQSTDAIRGKVGFVNGTHVWKIIWPIQQRGTNAVIGVATKDHILRKNGYVSLVGSEDCGYGWDISKGFCFHDAKEKDPWSYPSSPFIEDYSVPNEIYCILDMDEGYLAFSSADQFYGVAFRGLKGKKLYPMVSAVWGHCEITMEYMGALHVVPPLMEVCRREIRDTFLRDDEYSIDDLPLPNHLKRYVSLKNG